MQICKCLNFIFFSFFSKIHFYNPFIFRFYFTPTYAIKLFFYQNSDRYFTYDLQFYKKGDEHFNQAINDLRVCDSLCKAKNIYFNVVMLPYQSQLKSKNFTPQQLVKEYCEKDSIEFSDASEYLSKQTDINSLYLFADEIHFSEKGHRAIANFLSQ